MSSGEIAIVPVVVVVAAPVVGLGLVTAGVVAGGRAVVLAHQRSRVQAQQQRRNALIAEAGRLRVAGPSVSTGAPQSLGALAGLADALKRENDDWDERLAAERTKLSALQADVAEADGRRKNLAAWASEVDTAANPLGGVPSFRGESAVEEARLQIDALKANNAEVEAALKEAHARLDRETADEVWRKLSVSMKVDLDRDPQSSVERWRAPLRQRIKDAVDQAVRAATVVPAEIADAASTIESSRDRDLATAAVEAATQKVAEAVHAHAANARFDAALEMLVTEAEAMEDYVLTAECDRVRAEFLDKQRTLGAGQLSAWADAALAELVARREMTRRALEEGLALRAKAQRQTSIDVAYEALVETLLDSHSEVTLTPAMEEYLPSGGRLLRRNGDARFGVYVRHDAAGGAIYEPVAIGDVPLDEQERNCETLSEELEEAVEARYEGLMKKRGEEKPLPITFTSDGFEPHVALKASLFESTTVKDHEAPKTFTLGNGDRR